MQMCKMFDHFSYNTFLHSWSLVCFISLSLLLPKMCLFHTSDCSLFVKALLDLLCKSITSILKGRHRSPWEATLQSSMPCVEASQQQWEMDGVGHAICPLERCVGRIGSFQVGPHEVRVIQTACTHFEGWVLLRFHPHAPHGAPYQHR